MADDNQALLLQVSADIRGLEKAFYRASAVVKRSTKEMEASATGLEKFFGKPSLAKALDKTFDATRFKILDSGIARVGLFGGALESLGPAGLGAAAAIGLVTAAFAGAREAAKFADDIADTANRLHVTTDALQEYRFAIRAAGGDEKGADAALESFSETLGKAHEGLTKAQKGFLAIGFTKAQIDSMTDVDSALQQVADKLVGLSAADRDAAISQLGLTGLKEVLDGGAGKIATLRAEAQKLGIVMDADLVKRGGELNDQFETVSKVIDIQLKSALVDLGPILLGLLGLLADMAKGAADVADAFRSIQNKRTDNLKDLRDDFAKRAASPAGVLTRGHDLKRVAEIDAELNQREIAVINEKLKAADQSPTKTLNKVGKTGGAKSGPRDTTVQRTEQIAGELDRAEADILRALLDVASSAEARASLQKQIVDRETAAENARTNKEIADVAADKGISEAKRGGLILELELVKAKAREAADLQKQAIDREAAQRLADEALDAKQTTLDGEAALLQLQANLTFSETTRAQIALRLVDIAYQKEKAELEGLIASKTASDADRKLAQAKLDQLNARQPAVQEGAQRNASDPQRQATGIIAGVKGQSNAAADHAAVLAEIERQRQGDLQHERDYVQAKLQANADYNAARLQQTSDMFGNLATLAGSSNKTLAAIGKAAAITQATIDGVLAVQKALASAPPPFNFAIAAAVGVAAAVNVAKIAGFEDGGYTGDGGRKQVAGVVHGREYVVNAQATGRNRALLDHINAGGDLRGLLPSPNISVAAPAAAAAPVRGGDVNLHPTWHITNPDPDLGRMLEKQPRVLRRHLEQMIRDGEIKLPSAA